LTTEVRTVSRSRGEIVRWSDVDGPADVYLVGLRRRLEREQRLLVGHADPQEAHA
jgi:hypothetical protein